MPQPCTRRALSLALALLLLPAPHAWTEGSSGVTPQSDQASQALDLPDLRGKAPEGTFTAPGEAPFRSDTAYRSENVALTLTRTRDEESRSNVIVADVWVSSVQYLRRGFSENKWRGGMRSMRTIAPDAGAVLAITGDYAAELSAGPVVANGEIYRKNQNRLRDNCLILRDGRMLTYCRGTLDVAEALRGEVWHSFLFGPALLQDGQAIASFDSKIRQTNPRTALGYYEPGHYCFVVVDGRSAKSRGMTLEQLSRFMQALGCQAAYNLDGGQSAMMWFDGQIVNQPYEGGRRLMDIVYVPLDTGGMQ